MTIELWRYLWCLDIGSRSFGFCGLLGGESTQTLDHTGIWGVWMTDKLGDFFLLSGIIG